MSAAHVEVRLADGDGADLAVRRSPRRRRGRCGRRPSTRGSPVVGELDGGDEIEAEADEVDEVVAGERLAAEVRVHEAQAAEAPLGGAQAADVGQHQLAGVADDDVVDLPRAMDEDAHLPARLERDGRERASQLGGRDVVDRDAAAVEALEGVQRRGSEAGLVAVDFDGTAL